MHFLQSLQKRINQLTSPKDPYATPAMAGGWQLRAMHQFLRVVPPSSLQGLPEELQAYFQHYANPHTGGLDLPWQVAAGLYPQWQQRTSLKPELMKRLEELAPLNRETGASAEDDTLREDAEGLDLSGVYGDESPLGFLATYLEPVNDSHPFLLRLDVYGKTVELTLSPQWGSLMEERRGFLVQVGSDERVLVPLWMWSLLEREAALSQALQNEATRQDVQALFQAIQQFAMEEQAKDDAVGAFTWEDKLLDGVAFLSVSHLHLSVLPALNGDGLDVVPFHPLVAERLGVPADAASKLIQQALSGWQPDQTAITLSHQGQTLRLGLTTEQRKAVATLQIHLKHQDADKLRRFVVFPQQVVEEEGFDALKRCFHVDPADYGPRVTGLGEIVLPSGTFSRGARPSLLSKLQFDQMMCEEGVPNSGTRPVALPQDDQGRALVPWELETATQETRRVHIPLDDMQALVARATEALEQQSPLTFNDTTVAGRINNPSPITLMPTTQLVDELQNLYVQAQAVAQALPVHDDGTSATTAPAMKPTRVGLLAVDNVDDLQYTEQGEIRHVEGDLPWPVLFEELKPSFELKYYQRDGIAWLWRTFQKGQPGVLFADDMGLGKTLQALCFMALLIRQGWRQRCQSVSNPSSLWQANAFEQHHTYPHPILIVVPPVLLDNFEKEANTFFKDPDALFGEMLILHQDNLKRYIDPIARSARGHETRTGTPKLDIQRLKQHAVIICTYDTLTNYQLSLASIRWSLLLCDEVQKAKAMTTNISLALKAVAGNARFRVLMSGTPIENRIEELWNLMDTCAPGKVFGCLKAFREDYPELCDGAPPDEQKAAFERLNTTLKFNHADGWVMGRLKEDVRKDLPEKKHKPKEVAMTLAQQEALQQIQAGKGRALAKIQQVKQLFAHPFLYLKKQSQYPAAEAWVDACPRLQSLMETLDDIADKREKALVFCEFHPLQRTVQELITQRFGLGRLQAINSLVTSDRERTKQLLETFQTTDGFSALVLSPRCAGMGLNLQAANHVIHYTRWWNPAVEDQATCRAYRTGQTRPVSIYYFLTTEPGGQPTFDSVLHALLEEKRQLRRGLFDLGYLQDVSADTFKSKLLLQ